MGPTVSISISIYNADMASFDHKGDQPKREDGNQFCVHLNRCVLRFNDLPLTYAMVSECKVKPLLLVIKIRIFLYLNLCDLCRSSMLGFVKFEISKYMFRLGFILYEL